MTRDLITEVTGVLLISVGTVQTKHPRLVGLTWVEFCLGSGESGTEQPSRASSAARTARSDCGSTAGRFSLQQNTA